MKVIREWCPLTLHFETKEELDAFRTMMFAAEMYNRTDSGDPELTKLLMSLYALVPRI